MFNKNKLWKYFKGQMIDVTTTVSITVDADKGYTKTIPLNISGYLVDMDKEFIYIGDTTKSISTSVRIAHIAGVDVITDNAKEEVDIKYKDTEDFKKTKNGMYFYVDNKNGGNN